MSPYFGEHYGNPSGAHRLARDAVRAVDEAREQIAGAVGCLPGEVVFTSGGTESDNHAISGGMPPRDGVPVCSAVEHHAVLDPVAVLGGRTVGVDHLGRVDLESLVEVLDELGGSVSVVSVMLANNETGVVNDLTGVAGVIRARTAEVPRTPLHTDAVQAAAWLDLASAAAPADLISISGHKLGGPKGIGALVVRHHCAIRPLVLGGGQERGRRSGTPNVAGIVGLAAALTATVTGRVETNERIRKLRDRLSRGLVESIPEARATIPLGDGVELLPGTCHLCIEGVDAETLLFLMESEGVVASAASSCSSGAQQRSHVLSAMGVPDDLARGSLRLSLGWDSDDSDVDAALEAIPAAVRRVLEFS